MYALKIVDSLICMIEDWMMVVLTIVGLAMAVLQVILRYVFNTGIHWLEAAMVTSLIWGMLFGAVRAVRQGYHPRVEILSQILGYRMRVFFNLVALVLTVGLIVYYLYDSIFFTKFLVMIDSLHPELNVKQVWLYLIIPITMSLFLVRYSLLTITLFMKKPDSIHLEKPLLEIVSNEKEEDKS